ncbi:MAG: hypothetical protein OXE52_12240 [Chloroflexi bacterium]|nr:hypothetical protein [Chloroflexota bacterium]
MVDNTVTEVGNSEDRDCIRACQLWVESFIANDDRLVVDSFKTYEIISEYRRNVERGGVAENLLNQLLNVLFDRLIQIEIRFGDDGFAELPEQLLSLHGKDRKFVAVAIKCVPYAPILNATDTDWAQEKQLLAENEVTVIELCTDYIQARMSNA